MATSLTTTLGTLLGAYHLTEEECCQEVSEVHLDNFCRNCCQEEWQYLAPYLKVDKTAASDINRECQTELEKRLSFFKHWKQTNGSDATYSTLISALLQIRQRSDAEYLCKLLQAANVSRVTPTTATVVSSSGELINQAAAISVEIPDQDASTDQGNTSRSLPSLDPSVHADLRQQLRKYYRDIHNQFATYVNFICNSLLENKVTTEQLRSFLIYLPAFDVGLDSNERRCSLLAHVQKELEAADSINNIFIILKKNSLTSYWNYGIFESIVEEYNLDRNHEKLKYPEHFCAYARKHKVSEIMEIISPLSEVATSSDNVIVKFDYNPHTTPFETVIELKEALANALKLKSSALRLVSIEEGCVVVKFLISTVIADIITNSQFSSEQKNQLCSLSILWIKCRTQLFSSINEDSDHSEHTESVKEKIHDDLMVKDVSDARKPTFESVLPRKVKPKSATMPTSTGKSSTPLVNHIFQWDGGGREIFLVGSFSCWEKIPVIISSSTGGVCVDLQLPVGVHHYMFIVDGEWKHDPTNVLPITSTGHNQVNLVGFEAPVFKVESGKSDLSNTISVASQANSTSLTQGEATVELYLTFPSEAKKFIKQHFEVYGYKDNFVRFRPLKKPNKAVVTMTPACIGGAVISKLNGSMVLGQYKLSVKPARDRKRKKGNQKAPYSSSKPGPGTCRVYFGSRLPEYTNEQHVREHFAKFSQHIANIELIRDKKSQKFKGFGFVTFTSAAPAQAAIKALDHSTLLGVNIKVSLDKQEQQQQVAGPPTIFAPPAPSLAELPSFQQDTDDLSDSESISSNISAYNDKIKVIVHSMPDYLVKGGVSWGALNRLEHGTSCPPTAQTHHTPSNTVALENINPSLSEAEIKSLIPAPLFSSIRYPPPLNKVIVKLFSPGDARRVVEALNGKNIHGKIIKVYVVDFRPTLEQSHALPRASRYTRGIRSQPQSLQPQFATQLFYGPPTSQSQPQPLLSSPHLPASHGHPGPQGHGPGLYGQPGYPVVHYHLGLPSTGPSPPNPQDFPGQHSQPGFSRWLPPWWGGEPCTPEVIRASGSPSPGSQGSRHQLGAPVHQGPPSPVKVSTSVKVTHLPPTITKEKLYLHFRRAGEINGDPVIHATPKQSIYAYINFYDALGAQSAVNLLNGSIIDGVGITVKISKKQEPKPKVIDHDNHERILKLDVNQWNDLMMLKTGGSSKFKDVIAPYKTNPSVVVTPSAEESYVKFSGKYDAVEDAFSLLAKQLSKEIQVKSKSKKKALVNLVPNLPEQLNQRFGVTIPNFYSGGTTLKFEGSETGKAYDLVNQYLTSMIQKDIPLAGEYQLEQFERATAHVRAKGLVFLSCPESLPRNIVTLYSFDRNLLESITPEIQHLLSVNVVLFECSPEEAVFLKSFNKAFLKSLPAKVIFDDDEQITLSGNDAEVQISTAKMRDELAGLCSRKFSLSCNAKFRSQIEQILTSHQLEEPSFKYIVQKSTGGRKKGRRKQNQTGNEANEELIVYAFCRNAEYFKRFRQSFDHVKPGTKSYLLPSQGEEVHRIVSQMKDALKNKHSVQLHVDGACSHLFIHGLIPDKIQQCYDEIKSKIESTLIVTKYESVSQQLYDHLKLYKSEIAEIRRECLDLALLPPNKDHENGLIRIKGTISQVKDVRSRLKSELLCMNLFVETFDLNCPQGLFAIWCRRWDQLKDQEGKRSKTSINFSKESTADRKLTIRFRITGTDEVSVQEAMNTIVTEGVDIEEKVIKLSPGGAACLLKAKKDKKLDFMGNIIANVGNVDKQANTVVVCAPKELSDNLDTAEEAIRKFVGDRAGTSHVISSKDPVVGLILSTPAKSMEHLQLANVIARGHDVKIQCLKKPSVGVRITGTESAISAAKPHIYSIVIKAIEDEIGEELVPIKPLYNPFLSSPDFSRFLSKLESEFLVICSHPNTGSESKLVASSLIQLPASDSQVKVDICKGNLVYEPVDAIVNASNEDLKHIGGLAKAILDAGGPTIQTESDEYIRTHGKVRPGQVVCLGAGNLPCKNVIHAVGPRWDSGQKGEEQILYFSIIESLTAANKNQLTSIAFPAIGTGIFSVPVDICARASLKAVRDFCQAYPTTTIQNVKFVLFQSTAVDAFKPLLVSGVCGEYQYAGGASKSTQIPAAIAASLSSQNSEWKWLNDQGSFSYYSSDVSSRLTATYRANPQGTVQILINGTYYTIDFASMQQTNDATGHSRPIVQASSSGQASDVQWMYKDGRFLPYTPAESNAIEIMYQQKNPQQMSIAGNTYTFDFNQMCQINVNTGYKRPIDRRQVSQSATAYAPTPTYACAQAFDEEEEEDEGEGVEVVEEEVVKPKKDIILTLRGPRENLGLAKAKLIAKLAGAVKTHTVDKLPKKMTEELKKKIQCIASKNDVVCTFERKLVKGQATKVLKLEGVFFKLQATVSIIQEEILTFHVTSAPAKEQEFPPHWQPQTRTTELFPVSQGSSEWQRVYGKFFSTMRKSRVSSITRIQNKWIWEKYVFQRKRMHHKNNGRVNEMELFHGTRSNPPNVIYEGEDGFDMHYSRRGMWGVANYFAVNASYSHSYAYTSPNGRQMFLVTVLTGDSYQCQPDNSLRMPPTKQATGGGDVQISQMKYDTVTGHTNGSQVFMTYDNDKAYPAYLITYF